MTPASVGAQDQPILDFSDCHVGIVGVLGELTGLSRQRGPSPHHAETAQRVLAFFRDVIATHHVEEENDLFPAVLSDATAGDERAIVGALVQQLVQEHRRLEALFATLVPTLTEIAHGQDVCLDPASSAALVADYLAHARFEETEFLPLAQRILGRNSNHMTALGLSLHIRHSSQDIRQKFGFI